jgi:MoaA/NifB/PqqE/SkfB family radical SAM enzyme
LYKVTSRWPHQNSIKVEWNLGKRCNYDCSYCPTSIHDNTSEHTDIEVLKRTVDKLVALDKPVRLSFTGGEPTVHPKFEELINYCKHVGITWVSVTTNGTRKPEWYINQRADHWVFSLHFEYDYKKIATTISSVHKERQIMVNVMAHQDHMEAVKETVGYFDAVKVPCVIRRVRWTEGDHNLFDDMRYDGKDLDWILSRESTVKDNVEIHYETETGPATRTMHANDVIKLHKNEFKGWTCNAGLESLMINWDGEVHRATCRVGGSLGNIYHDSFVAPIDPITCTRDWCTCSADIPLTKYDKNHSN